MQVTARLPTRLLALLVVGSVSVAEAQSAPPLISPSPVEIPSLPQPLRLAEPMSQRLILIRAPSFGGSFKLERGDITLVDSRYATGLDSAVVGSERAVALAREAHSDLVTGAVLIWTGLGVLLASAVGIVVLSAVNAPASNSSPSPAYEAGASCALGGLIVGLVLDLVGIPYQMSGLRNELDAVNAYNSDLVDGNLRYPAR